VEQGGHQKKKKSSEKEKRAIRFGSGRIPGTDARWTLDRV
jgi:hypothetical protein